MAAAVRLTCFVFSDVLCFFGRVTGLFLFTSGCVVGWLAWQWLHGPIIEPVVLFSYLKIEVMEAGACSIQLMLYLFSSYY